MSKSILHNKAAGTCYLCMKLHGDYARRTVLEEHHCMKGSQYRHLAEKYGLKVYLCPQHHRGSEEAPHDNPSRGEEINALLQQAAQKAFEKKHSYEKWMEVFGRNFI